MASDFAQFAITPTGLPVTIPLPGWTLAAQVVDSSTGALLADFTGTKAIQFPAILGQLSQAQQEALLQTIAPALLHQLAGA